MISDSIQLSILQEYDDQHKKFDDLAPILVSLARMLLSESGQTVHSVTNRCKPKESFSKKLTRPDKQYSVLSDITDIVGLRITTYFSDDVDSVAKILEKEFVIDHDQSIDKRVFQDPNRFGYQSLHYIAQISPERAQLVEYRRFVGLRFEIQIRSILQHAWAEIEHDLGYKSTVEIPKEIRRRFARIAGLLELADSEFVSIRQAIESYSQTVQTNILQNPNLVELNLISLRALYSGSSNLEKLDNIVADVASSNIDKESVKIYELSLTYLPKLGFSNIASIENIAEQEKENIK